MDGAVREEARASCGGDKAAGEEKRDGDFEEDYAGHGGRVRLSLRSGWSL